MKAQVECPFIYLIPWKKNFKMKNKLWEFLNVISCFKFTFVQTTTFKRQFCILFKASIYLWSKYKLTFLNFCNLIEIKNFSIFTISTPKWTSITQTLKLLINRQSPENHHYSVSWMFCKLKNRYDMIKNSANRS